MLEKIKKTIFEKMNFQKNSTVSPHKYVSGFFPREATAKDPIPWDLKRPRRSVTDIYTISVCMVQGSRCQEGGPTGGCAARGAATTVSFHAGARLLAVFWLPIFVKKLFGFKNVATRFAIRRLRIAAIRAACEPSSA